MYKDKEKKRGKDTIAGITLVALVVTIVVLLILAGITITMLFGDEGIINKAQDAADKTNESQTQEKNDIKDLSGILDNAMIPRAKLGKKVDDGTLYAKYIAKTDDNKDIVVPVPGGYTVIENTEKSNKINDGIVIQDDLGNEFVWVPVNDEQFTRMYDAENKSGKIYRFEIYDTSKSSWITYEEPELIEYSPNGYCEPHALKNFSSGDGVTGDESKGIEQLKNVVGIVKDEGVIDEKQNILDKWEIQLQEEFDKMIKSVERYKGFYVGRYETGNLEADKNNKPIVKKGDSKLTNINWYYMYQTSKNIKVNNNVTTSMIWDCQFVRTLEWIAQTNEGGYSILKDAKNWSNCYDYDKVTGDTSTESGKLLPSGTNEAWKKNNIYDIAGNAWEWNQAAYSNQERMLRRWRL